jgi:hypothetical protein
MFLLRLSVASRSLHGKRRCTSQPGRPDPPKRQFGGIPAWRRRKCLNLPTWQMPRSRLLAWEPEGRSERIG